MEQHPAGLSLKTSLPLHEPMAEKEEKGGECQGGVETLSSACSWTNRSQQFAWRHALPALSAAVDSATRYLLNHCQPNKLKSGAATSATLITGAGALTDGSFLWGGGVTTYSLMPWLKVKRQLYLRKKMYLPFVCQFILNGVHHWWDRQFQRLLLLRTSSRLSVLLLPKESWNNFKRNKCGKSSNPTYINWIFKIFSPAPFDWVLIPKWPNVRNS